MKFARPFLALLALSALAACAGTDNYVPKAEPSFYRNLAQPGAELDAAAAASMISGYRGNNSLPAVTLDPVLMKLAQEQSEAMAKRDNGTPKHKVWDVEGVGHNGDKMLTSACGLAALFDMGICETSR